MHQFLLAGSLSFSVVVVVVSLNLKGGVLLLDLILRKVGEFVFLSTVL